MIELFMRAQVGQNSYAFMGQGMVEQALSLRPEDRRALIEEAADVRIYRTKLEDAQKKLKATRENVERAGMLVREIDPRINQLERQAGRAVRYQELAQELAATLHVWYSAPVARSQRPAPRGDHDAGSARRGLRRGPRQREGVEDGLAQLRAAIDERRARSRAASRIRQLQDYVRDLERRVALDGERAKMLTTRAEELAAEIAQLQPT